MRHFRATRLIAILLGTIPGCLVSAAWTQQAYLWQRQWTPAVVASVETAPKQLDGMAVLVAEQAWRAGEPEQVKVHYKANILASLKTPLAFVLRIGPYGGPFSHSDSTASYLAEQADMLLQQAKANGITVTEFQIDFDCAESKLSGYREWLLAIRSHLKVKHPSVKLSFTALPAWLRHKEAFRSLAAAADSFVLQVHSLEKPESFESPITLCNPEQSLKWAKQASEIGKPFLVALPTYGYELIFDADGNFTALVAEGKRPAWQEGTHVRVVRSDPAEMAQLAQTLADDPPEHCDGIVWFRLPVSSDRLNWSMATFLQVLDGDIPKPNLVCEAKPSADDPKLVYIFLKNTGDTRMPFPKAISVMWESLNDIIPIAWDASGVFSITLNPVTNTGVISSSFLSPSASIAPGQSITLAWMRFNQPTTLSVKTHDT